MKKIFIALFILIPLTLSAVIFLSPDRAISENENRSLKTLKQISLDSLQDDMESYLCDQLPLRDTVVSAKSGMLYALGRRDINGCYICKDRFIQKITDSDIDRKSIGKYADRINQLADRVETFVMLVPSSGTELKSSLPKNAEMYDYDSLYEELSARYGNAKMIDVRAALKSRNAYYLTDHHWTAEGAYSAYREFCNAAATAPEEFELMTVAEDFRGTLYSKALINNNLYDTIKAPVIDGDITVTADGREIELYDKSALETKDKYNFFEGGNHGVLTIENHNVGNDRVLLILKDSFANSFVPYLINDYSKIILLDERYAFTTPGELVESEGVTQMLVLKEIIS